MKQYIDKTVLVAQIERRKDEITFLNEFANGTKFGLETAIDIINSLEVKESKLPNPRFPHLENIVDKVFGAGNLELWEYEEAEQLVLLAKEELLKDLEVKEVDLEKEIEKCLKRHSMLAVGKKDFTDIAKYFFELGMLVSNKAQKGEEL